MHPGISQLQAYPFEKLNLLLADERPNQEKTAISLSIGEPKHAAPDFALAILRDELHLVSRYAGTRGTDALRESIAAWLITRFQLAKNAIDPERQVLPVAGTREGLFSFTQALLDKTDSYVLYPNPFYQIYEGASLLAGAKSWLLACDEKNGYLPDYRQVPERIWKQCQLVFVCSPGNPTGAVANTESLTTLIELSDRYGFVIAADECYSEIYTDDTSPPLGLLQCCQDLGRSNFKNCVVFHSLSKRSNIPGMRSGFVAGDANILKQYLKYRTYHGCAMPLHHQKASAACWADEQHVIANRRAYRQKFRAVLPILQDVMQVTQSDASFYLWPKTPIADVEFARRLYVEENVTVLPGSYLSRMMESEAGTSINPGSDRIRMALVAPLEECIEAAERIKQFIEKINSRS